MQQWSENLNMKVVADLSTPFIKMVLIFFYSLSIHLLTFLFIYLFMYLFMYLLRVCGCVCLKMSFHYLEREISLENQVNSWKKKLDLCEGRLNFYLFLCSTEIYTTHYFPRFRCQLSWTACFVCKTNKVKDSRQRKCKRSR